MAVRFVSRFSWLMALGISSFFPAEAHERLVMPFSCDVDGGEVRLSASAETSYRIIGGRDEHTVTTCMPTNSAGCRTVMAHRFTIACQGGTVAWMRIAAAIRGASSNRAWIEDGRLNLVLPAHGDIEAQMPCRPGAVSGGASQHRVVLSGDCLPWARRAAFEHLVLPDGFAPVGELGARLMVGAAADEVEASEPVARLIPVAMTSGEITIAKTDPNAELQPGPRRTTFDTVLEPDLAGDDWITVVHSGAEAAIIPRHEEEGARTWALLLVIASSAVIALLLAARLVPVMRARSARATSLSLARSDLSLGNASKAIEALVQQTELAARQLKGAGPLREVLQAELNLVRERLASIEKQADKGELAPDKSALQFRGLVRELERIRRIVDSALASLSGTKKSTTLPRTTSEAYEVLGVNAEVSAGVLKKIVDALRMSWHPDHARDADDRMLREDRIRQINIAWDLINGKREAA